MGSRSCGREDEETDPETEQMPRAPGRVICLCLYHSLNSDHDPALGCHVLAGEAEGGGGAPAVTGKRNPVMSGEAGTRML